jgi:uncharacterized protein YegJ (DUF2314 family)
MSGKDVRRGTRGAARERATKTKVRPSSTASDAKLYGGLAVLVAGLAALVWWSLPGNHAVETFDAGSSEEEELATEPGPDGSTDPERGITRPPMAAAELAVITDRPADEVAKIATTSEIARRLEARHCGDACDAIRKLMTDEDRFAIETVKTEDLLLPPADTMDTVAPGLTPSQRESIASKTTSVVVRTEGPIAPEQLPARAAFATAAVLAEALDGFVYDEVARRIETKGELASHTVTAKLGEPAFVPKHIAIQLYRQDDGTARLLTLGMARFGSPDISVRGANMSAGPALAELVNAAAAKIAHGANGRAITVTLDDIARLVGKKPADLRSDPGSARPVSLDIVVPERIEGDPDNTMVELVPEGGGTTEAWDLVIASLFGMPSAVTAPVDDKELAAIAKKAQHELPGAIKRFQAGEGALFIKGPFAIPLESRLDGGASTEMLWIEVASCDSDRCTGTLSNEPTYATNIALGKTTSVRRSEAADWVIQHGDGGLVGGESIKALKARAMK